MNEINILYFLASLILFIIILNDLIVYNSYHKNEFGKVLKVYKSKNNNVVFLLNLIMALAFIIYVEKRINAAGFGIVCIPAFVIIFMMIIDTTIKMRRKWMITKSGIVCDGVLLKWKDINVLKWNDNEMTFIFRNRLFSVPYNEKVSIVPLESKKNSLYSMLKRSKN